MQYYDAVTGDFTTRGLPTGSDSKVITIESVYQKKSWKNNYQVPVYIELWIAKPKKDTSSAPNADYDAGILDVVTNVAMLPSFGAIYPSDSPLLMERWSMHKVKAKLLKPGDFVYATHTEKLIKYDPQTVGTETYQKALKNFAWVTILRGHPGTIGHNNLAAPTLFGQVSGSCDGELETTVKICYDGGIAAHRLHVNNNPTLTVAAGDTGLVSQYVADVQGISAV